MRLPPTSGAWSPRSTAARSPDSPTSASTSTACTSGAIYTGTIPTTYSDGRTRVGTRGYSASVVHYNPYEGYIDEVMLFGRALSEDEILSMYANFDKMIP